MATPIYDTFTDTSGTNLESHTPDTGGAWTRHPSYTSARLQISNANRCRKSADAAAACYYNATDPGADEYEVVVTLRCMDTTGAAFGPAARIDASAATMYICRYSTAANRWELYKIVAFSATLLGYWSDTFSVGTEREVRLAVATGSQTVTVDGTDRITAYDTAITARGYAGLREGSASPYSDTAGMHADDFTVTNALADGTYPAWARRASGVWTPGRR